MNGYLLTAVLVALFNYLKTGTKDELPVPLFILLVVVIFFDISVVIGLGEWWERHAFRSNPESRRLRIAELTRSLNIAMNTIELIRRDVEENSALLADLEAKAATQGKLVELRREEIEAVADLLRVELRREGRKGYLVGFLTNLLFFVLGVGFTLPVTGRVV